MFFKRNIFFNLIFGVTMSSAISNFAFAEGFIETVGGTHIYNMNLESSDLDNNIGFTTGKDYSTGGVYSVRVYCTKYMPTDNVYYTAISDLEPSLINTGFYKLNDYLDVKIEVYISGGAKRLVLVPFTNVSNQNWNVNCNPPWVQLPDFESGSRGKVTFRVTKKIVNGVMVQNREILRMYGRAGQVTSAIAPNPMVRVNVGSAMLTVPDKCIINEGQQLDINFGDIVGSEINDKKISKPVPVSFRCEGGGFESNNLKIKLSVSGDSAAFDANLLRTNKPELGVKFTRDQTIIAPNNYYPVVSNGNIGHWDLNATLISRNNEDVEEGEFNASAVIVAAFQ